MGHLKLLFSNTHQRPEGLTYAEVMVSMLTSALFLSTTLQAYIAATSIRARTQQVNTAIATIQADIETIRQMAQRTPQSAAECQRPSSYAQQLMVDLVEKATAALSLSPQQQPPDAVISPIQLREGEFVLEQHTTLPVLGLSRDYTLHRIFSIDQGAPPAEQVLEISYQVFRNASQSEIGDKAQQPQSIRFEGEAPIAQQHITILPKAALVCFL